MKTPFPGGEPVGLHDARRARDRAASPPSALPRPSSTSFANAFEPSIRAAAALGPEDRDPRVAKPVGDARDERRLRPDHDEVGGQLARQVEQALAVVGPHGMALGERGDAGIAGRRVQRRERRAARQLPRERVLARARPDQQHPHAGESSAAFRTSSRSRRAPGSARHAHPSGDSPLSGSAVAAIRVRTCASSRSGQGVSSGIACSWSQAMIRSHSAAAVSSGPSRASRKTRL